MTASNVILQNPQTRYGSRDGELVEGSHDEKSLFGRGVCESEQIRQQDGCGIARRAGGVALPLIVGIKDLG